MNVLAVVVGLLAVVTALNLFILLGVIRRLREMSVPTGPPESGLPTVGTAIGAFAASTVDGVPLTEEWLATGRSLVILLSPNCKPCQDAAVNLAAQRDRLPHDTVVLVAAGEGESGLDSLVESLRGIGTVAVCAEPAAVESAFGVDGYPSAIVVRDGLVEFASFAFTDALPMMRDEALTR